MIKEATNLGLDSIGITNGQIQYDRYDGQREDKKEEEDKLAAMYKSQERPLDIDSYSLIPSRY